MSDSILSALRGGDAAQALALADALLAESPGQAEAHYWRALALRTLGREPESVESLDRAILLAPDRADFAVTRSVMQLTNRDLDEVQAGLMDALALDPNQLQAYIGLIHIAVGQSNLAEARRLLRLVERIYADDDFVHVSRGVIAQAEGDLDSALRNFTTAAETNPSNALALASMGLIHLHRKMPAFAEQALARADALSPGNAGVLRALIQAQLEQNDIATAEQTVERLLHILPDDPAALRLRQGLRRTRGDHAGALQDALTLYTLAPSDLDALNRLCSAYLQSGNPQRVAELLETAVTDHPDNDAFWQLRAGYEASLTGDGGTVLERWLLSRPDSAVAHESAAVYAEARGDLDVAKTAAEKAISLSTSVPMAQFVKLRQEFRDDPESALARAEALVPSASTPEAQRMLLGWLGLIHDRLQRFDSAASAFLQMIRYLAPHKPLPALRDAVQVPEEGLPARGRLLWSPAGARVERVFNALAPALGPHLLVDRNQPSAARRDGFGAFRMIPGSEGAGSAMTWKAGILALGLQPEDVIDWLPQWDGYTAAALKGARLTAMLVDPRDALLNWLVFGSTQSYLFMPEPTDSARWLADTFSAVADTLDSPEYAANSVHIDGMDEDAESISRALQRALALDDMPSVDLLGTPIMALGGMPNQFPAGHWRHYKDAFADAFALLTPVAVRLGYPAE